MLLVIKIYNSETDCELWGVIIFAYLFIIYLFAYL